MSAERSGGKVGVHGLQSASGPSDIGPQSQSCNGPRCHHDVPGRQKHAMQWSAPRLRQTRQKAMPRNSAYASEAATTKARGARVNGQSKQKLVVNAGACGFLALVRQRYRATAKALDKMSMQGTARYLS